MEQDQRIVAVGLLTERDLDALGSGFRRAYKVDDVACFENLIAAIDRADREMRTGRTGADQ